MRQSAAGSVCLVQLHRQQLTAASTHYKRLIDKSCYCCRITSLRCTTFPNLTEHSRIDKADVIMSLKSYHFIQTPSNNHEYQGLMLIVVSRDLDFLDLCLYIIQPKSNSLLSASIISNNKYTIDIFKQYGQRLYDRSSALVNLKLIKARSVPYASSFYINQAKGPLTSYQTVNP